MQSVVCRLFQLGRCDLFVPPFGDSEKICTLDNSIIFLKALNIALNSDTASDMHNRSVRIMIIYMISWAQLFKASLA